MVIFLFCRNYKGNHQGLVFRGQPYIYIFTGQQYSAI